MKQIVFLATLFLCTLACNKEAVIRHDSALESRASGRDVCAWVSSFKLIQRKESNGTYTITADYAIKNCNNIIPIIISLETTNVATGAVSTQTNLPFSSKINLTGLNPGDSFSFRLYTNAADTGELLDAQTQSTVVVAK
jgi:hypothetical protein